MPITYAMLSTYPPTQCGLATFSAALLAHLHGPGDHVAVVRVLDEPVPPAPGHVVHDLVNGSAASAAAAARVMNDFDVVIVQHEYGIYGGPDGRDIVSLLEALHVPSIVVLHTVLATPTLSQRLILDAVTAAASAIVTMTQTARSRLLDIYGADPEKVFVIPHGAADNRVAAPSAGNTGQPRVLTWGLLGPGKGIEHGIDAVALLRDHGLRVDYQVAGQTHPRVLGRDGEAYRQSLEARARIRDVVDHVHCFPHAVELLGGGAGLLVERQDPDDIAHALRRVLTEPGLSARMSGHSADLAPRLLWPAVASSYRELASALTRTRVLTRTPALTGTRAGAAV